MFITVTVNTACIMIMTFLYATVPDLSLLMSLPHVRISSVAFRLNTAPGTVTDKGVMIWFLET